ncbi:MAG: hypothetical protein ACI9G5_001339 [Paracoccaceae bacterium]|jgi:hypothetical protein
MSSTAGSKLRLFIVGWVFLCAGIAQAAPWIDPSDARLRHHIHVLADAALIRIPVNTWPLMWSGVISEVNLVKSDVLSPSQHRAVDYIQQAFKQQSQSSVEMGFRYAEQRNPIRGFGDVHRDKAESHLSAEYIGERWAGRLRATNVDDPLDGDHTISDGSYLSGLLGNWVFTVGAIDRWWGPAWESGLILSNNARPVPAISLQRNSSEPFDWSLLHWLGPWQFTTFIGELESDRIIANTKLVGARFSFRPTKWLEFGASRTAQWGGKGRPQDFSSFKDVILGNADNGGGPAGSDPSNQLAGFDWRFSIDCKIPVGVYGEMIGEDEAGYQPSKRIFVMGVDAAIPLSNSELRLVFESADTATRRVDKGEGEFNVAYEHSTYRSGYRHRGRSIGASVDNDSRAHHLSAQWYAGRHSLNARLSQFDLNTDGGGSAFADGNSASYGSSNDYAANIVYRYRVAAWYAQLGYYHYNDRLKLRGTDAGDDTVEFALNYRW